MLCACSNCRLPSGPGGLVAPPVRKKEKRRRNRPTHAFFAIPLSFFVLPYLSFHTKSLPRPDVMCLLELSVAFWAWGACGTTSKEKGKTKKESTDSRLFLYSSFFLRSSLSLISHKISPPSGCYVPARIVGCLLGLGVLWHQYGKRKNEEGIRPTHAFLLFLFLSSFFLISHFTQNLSPPSGCYMPARPDR